MTQFSNGYDLEERTAKFGEEMIGFCRSLKQDSVSNPVINQIVRSSTSIGAKKKTCASFGKKIRN